MKKLEKCEFEVRYILNDLPFMCAAAEPSILIKKVVDILLQNPSSLKVFQQGQLIYEYKAR